MLWKIEYFNFLRTYKINRLKDYKITVSVVITK